MKFRHAVLPIAALLVTSATLAHAADPGRRVMIEIENLSGGQVLSTSAFVAHRHGLHLWTLGQSAGLPIQEMAEEGNPEWLLGTAVFGQEKDFGDAAAAIPVLPGQKRHVELTVTAERPEISGAAMIGQTNDGFAGVDAVPAFGLDKPISVDLLPLDAGTAKNVEDKAHLRAMGGFGREPEAGMVAPHPGLQPGAAVPSAWRFDPAKPIARVTITPLPTPRS